MFVPSPRLYIIFGKISARTLTSFPTSRHRLWRFVMCNTHNLRNIVAYLSIWTVPLFPAALVVSVVRFNLFDVDRLLSAAASYNVVLVVLGAGALIMVPRAAEAASGLQANSDRTRGRRGHEVWGNRGLREWDPVPESRGVRPVKAERSVGQSRWTGWWPLQSVEVG